MRRCLNYRPALVQLSRSSNHLGVSGWIVVMSFRPEAFRLDPFSKVRFWRGCLLFLVKRRQPLSDRRTRGR